MLVRGYQSSQRGSFTLTITSSSAGGGGGRPQGNDCVGCFWRNTCRAQSQGANPEACQRNGGQWMGGGSPCDGGVTLASRTGSVDFTDSYDDSAQCMWTITCPARGQVPTFTFSAMDTESGFDFVQLFSQPNQPISERLSGSEVPSDSISSTGQTMMIQFTSDGSVQGAGFSGDYTCGRARADVRPPPPPGMLRVPSHVAGSIDRGGQTVRYNLQATAGTTYTIESSAASQNPISDTYITIYDASGQNELAHDDDSGDGTQAMLTWTCPDTGTYVIEVRGFSRRQTGAFELDVSMAGGGQGGGGGGDPCSGQGLRLSGSGTIAFGEGSYIDNAACMWSITCPDRQHVSLSFESLDTERGFDWVDIYDGPNAQGRSLAHVSGDSPEPANIVTQGPSAFVQFTPDGSVTHGGFDLSYDCGSGGGGGGGQCTPIRVDSRPVRGDAPTSYCLNAEAGHTYELTVELLTLHDSVMSIMDPRGQQIERNDDDGGSLASHLIWTAPSNGQYTVMVEGFGQATGTFALEVQSVGSGGSGGGDPCGGGITLTGDHASIDFDDTGVTGATCDWTIRCSQGRGVSFVFNELSIENNFDFVSLYDGPNADQSSQILHATGSQTPQPQQASGQVLLIEYTSDGSVNQGGFSGSYTCGRMIVDPPRPGSGLSIRPDGRPASGTVSEGCSSDGGCETSMYSLQASGGVTYEIEVTLGELPDSVLELYAPNGREMLLQNDDYGGSLASYIEWTCPSDDTYFILVRGFSPMNTGSFTLAVTTQGGSSGGEHGDPCDGGLNLAAPSAVISYQPRGQYEDNAHCVWAVTCPNRGQVPSFTFTALDTENGFDFVAIEDGNAITAGSANLIDQVSGTLDRLERSSYQSGSQSMTIEFSTDGSVTGVGFEGSYSCGRPSGPQQTCTDTIEELNGRGACASFLAQGFSCAQRFCPTCTYSSMCDATCGFCGGGSVGNACESVQCGPLRRGQCARQDSCCTWDGNRCTTRH